MNRGSPMVAKIVTSTVNSESPARAAGGTNEDVPGSRLLGSHARDRPF